MSHPLSALTRDEQRIYADLTTTPLATDTPQILADSALDQGQEHRSALLRQQTRLPLLELLRGQALTEQESTQVAARIRALLTSPTTESQPAQAAAPERELAAALGVPQSGDAMLQLLDANGNLDAQRLREQYDFQVTLLASLDLLEDQDSYLGITGIDTRFHTLPRLSEIQRHLQTPALRQKIAQGFNQLLLVPFALPLKRLLDAWRRDLLRNDHLLQQHGVLNTERPMWMWEEGYALRDGWGPDEDGRLAYFPERFTANHDGKTKEQLLATSPTAGWQVLLTEGSIINLPRAGKGQTIAGRRQIEAGRTPQQYLQSLPEGEIGWTLEAYVTAFCTQLERSGHVLDDQTFTYLLAAFLRSSRVLACACWFPVDRQAYLSGFRPDDGFPNEGGRAAVRVI